MNTTQSGLGTKIMLFVVFVSELLSQYETITATIFNFEKKTSGVCDFICCQGVRTSIFFFFFTTGKAQTNKMVYSKKLRL